MKYKLLAAAVALASFGLGSCNKESATVNPDTNPATGMSYELRAVNTTSGINHKATAHGTIQWTSGYANPKQVKFEAKQKNTKIEYTSTNTARIDLFAPVPVSFGGFMLPAGTYKEIELKLKLSDDGPDPALYLAGTYSDDQITVPVIFEVHEDVHIKTEMKDVTIDQTTSIAAITTMDLASYTHGIKEYMFRNATLTNGVLIISEDSNKPLYKIMLKNLSDKRHKCEFKHKH